MNVIKFMRLKCGFTQCELAEKLGVTQSTIAYYEKGEPQAKTIRKVSEATGVKLNENIVRAGADKGSVEVISSNKSKDIQLGDIFKNRVGSIYTLICFKGKYVTVNISESHSYWEEYECKDSAVKSLKRDVESGELVHFSRNKAEVTILIKPIKKMPNDLTLKALDEAESIHNGKLQGESFSSVEDLLNLPR